MKLPKVSVAIISYNHAKYLPFAIESALSQSYPDMEILIVDDGSPDESLSIAQSYAEKHPGIRVITHPNHVNKGIAATCNLAIENSNGEYISILGSDDVFYPFTIKEQAEFLDFNPDVGMVNGIPEFIDKQGHVVAKMSDENIWSHSVDLEAMISRNRVCSPTVMVRKSCYEEVGLYDETLLYSDYDMWLRIPLFSRWKIGFINKPIAFYRVHGKNTSVGIQPEVGLYRDLLVLLNIEKKLIEDNRKASFEHNLIKNQINEQNYNFFAAATTQGETLKAIRYIYTYLTYKPFYKIGARRAAIIVYRLSTSLLKKSISV